MRNVLRKTVSYVVLGCVGLFMLFPFLWMFSTSVKPAGDVFKSFDSPIKALVAGEVQWRNYGDVYGATQGVGGGVGRGVLNSGLCGVDRPVGEGPHDCVHGC